MTGEGNHNADRGSAFEKLIARRLRAEGWHVVKSGGSLGPADLIALAPGRVLLIQCKGGAKIMSHGEWNELLALAEWLGVWAIVADRPARGVYRYRRLVAEHTERARYWSAELYVPTAAGR